MLQVIILIIPILPFLIATILIAGLELNAAISGSLTLGITILIALFRVSPDQLFLALGSGLGQALVVFYIIFPSLILYRLLQSNGSLKVLGRSIAYLVPQGELQVLLLILGLAPFTESVSGFGVGTLLIIPIFQALDYSIVQSALLGMLGQMAVPWGGLALGTSLGAQLTNLDPHWLGANTALITAPLPPMYAVFSLWIIGGGQAVRRRWPIAVVTGSLLSFSLWAFSLFPGIELAGILGGIVVILFLVFRSQESAVRPQKRQLKELQKAMTPYGILTLLMLASRLILPLKNWLQSHLVLSIPTINLQLPLLYNPGAFLLITCLLTLMIFKTRKCEVSTILHQSYKKFVPGAIAISCFLCVSSVMQGSGMTSELGKTATSVGDYYQWMAPTLAAFGGWLTGSNVGSNALFSGLQQQISINSGLLLPWLMAAQNAASSHATIIAPSRIILATTALSWNKGEGIMFRQLFPIVLAAIALITGLSGVLSH